MPYKNTELAVESSPYYKKYKQNELERKREEVLRKRTNYLTNPKFAETITRDTRGFLVSFTNPLDFGKADEEKYELVTIELKKRNFINKFIKKIDTTFNIF